ncbi:hypothetical protein BsWGS_19725 [Bradybaena similaris]
MWRCTSQKLPTITCQHSSRPLHELWPNRDNSRGEDGSSSSMFKQHITYLRPTACEYNAFPPPYMVPVCWDWTLREIDDWLVNMGHGKYREIFHHLNMDGKKLTKMDAHFLRRSGIRDWNDCIVIAEAAEKLSESTAQLNVEEFTKDLYRTYPALNFGKENVIPRGGQFIHRTERFHRDPFRDEICRRLYRTAGDPFGYLNSVKHYSTI